MLNVAPLGCMSLAMAVPREGESLERAERWQRLLGLQHPLLSLVLFFSSLGLLLFLSSWRFLALEPLRVPVSSSALLSCLFFQQSREWAASGAHVS